MTNQCRHCGKLDYDDPSGCQRPAIYSPAVGDWLCDLELNKVDTMYYIKSEKGYWLPGGYGYTKNKADAGVFTLADMQQLALDGCTLELAHGY